MKRILLIIVFCNCIFTNAYTQKISDSLTKTLKPAIDSLENRIDYLISRNTSLSKMKDLKQFHIYFLNHDSTLRKQDFMDNSFINKLHSDYYEVDIKRCTTKEKVPYLRANTIICNSNYEEIAGGDARYINLHYNPIYSNIVRLFAANAIDLVINLGMNGVYICIKNNDIFVFKDTNEELQMYSLKEFAKCCYGELCPWCLRLNIINDEGSNR